MTTSSAAQARVEAVLVGAALGGARAARTQGLTRAEMRATPPHAPRVDHPGVVAGLLTEGGVAEHWVARAVRDGLTRRCDPMGDFVSSLDLAGTRLETAAHACVAAAVSAVVEGSQMAVVSGLAVMATDLGGDAGVDVAGPDLAARLHWASALAARAEGGPEDALDLLVGTSAAVQECVPAALAFVGARAESPVPLADLLAAAAALGGESDVIVVVAGALLAGLRGLDDVPGEVLAEVRAAWPDLPALAAAYADGR